MPTFMLYSPKNLIAIIVAIIITVILLVFLIRILFRSRNNSPKDTTKGEWLQFGSETNDIFGGKWNLDRGIKMYRPWFGNSTGFSDYLGCINLKEKEYITVDFTKTPIQQLGIYHEVNVYSYPSLTLLESIPMFKKGSFKVENCDTTIMIMLKVVGCTESNVESDTHIGSDRVNGDRGDHIRSFFQSNVTIVTDDQGLCKGAKKITVPHLESCPGNINTDALDAYYDSLINEWGNGYFCTGRCTSEIQTIIPKSKSLWISNAKIDLKPGEWVLIIYPNSPVSWFDIKSPGVPDYSESTYVSAHGPIDHIIYSQQGKGGTVDINMTHYTQESGLNFHCYVFTNM
jgi:hypothetical protein